MVFLPNGSHVPRPVEATLERRANGQTRRAQRLLEETEQAVQRRGVLGDEAWGGGKSMGNPWEMVEIHGKMVEIHGKMVEIHGKMV